MIGDSGAMMEVYKEVHQVAESDTTVLIRGESGVGKELLAQAIHDFSDRADKPFIRVNCASLNENLLESELFGHVKGAFTGAIAMRKGRLEEADGGTLFLDEIGDFTPPIQVKLLRVLQERTYEQVGSSTTLRADIRLVCATNVDLEKAIRTRKFREDLYYRINVFPITLPPLRERKEDIIPLADYFIEKCNHYRGDKKPRLSATAVEFLLSYSWPGNVRELENVIERGILLCEDGLIQEEHLKRKIQTPLAVSSPLEETLARQVAAFEENIIRRTLRKTKGNCKAAAKILGTTSRILTYKVNRYNIDSSEYKSQPKRS